MPASGDRSRLARLARASLVLAAVLLTVRAAAPAPANAVDLFPVDDWLGSGMRKASGVVLGPLKLGAEEIARLLVTIVGALADLLVPKSLVRAGLDGVRWLVELPPVGTEVDQTGTVGGVRMPHLVQLKDVLTWIGITVLPLSVVVTGGRALLAPTANTASPGEVLERALVAGLGLLVYDWAWGALVRLERLLTDALLGLPWVADGIERMFETLLIGGAAGTAVAAEFVIPLLILFAGGALLGLLLLHVGLTVVTALIYAVGGLALGGSVTPMGRRLLSAWLIAVGATVLLPLLWTVVFVTGAALMLDAEPAGGGGLAGFVAQLFNVSAALAVFVVAIKLARGVWRQAGGAIGGLASQPVMGGGGGGGAGGGAARSRELAANATPAGLVRFSRQMRGVATRGASAAISPLRHPGVAGRAGAAAMGRPVQATRTGAESLRGALTGPGGAALVDVARARATRRRGPLGRAAASSDPSQPAAAGAARAGGMAGGRRAQAARARAARERTRRLASTDWHASRSVSGPARTDVARPVRFTSRPWWMDRPRVVRPGRGPGKGAGRG